VLVLPHMSTQDLSGGGFNFDTQAGVAHLLASVRAANISAEQKNDLRDTIFLYTNGGRDQTVRLSLEQKLATYAVVPVGVVPGTTQPTSPMSFTRTVPDTFSVSNTQPATPPVTPPPAPQPTTPTAVSPAQPVETTQMAPQTPVTPPPVAQAPTPQAQPAVPPTTATPTPVTPPVTPEPAPVSAQATPVAPPLTGQDPAVFLTRIREIKSLVNQQVGNPVNLVDINNEVGREYMGALLDAMKKINSGASAVSAMQRLETAFESVKRAIADHDAGGGQPPVTPVPLPTPPPPVQPAIPTPPAPSPVETAQPSVVAEPAIETPPVPQPVPPPPPKPEPVQSKPIPPPPKPEPVPPKPIPPPEPKPVPPPPPPAPPPPPQPTPQPVVTPPPAPPEPAPEKELKPEPMPVPTPPPTKEFSHPQPASETELEPQKKEEPEPGLEATTHPEPKPEVENRRVPLQEIPNLADKKDGHHDEDDARWSKSSLPHNGEQIAKVSSLADTLADKKQQTKASTPAPEKAQSGDPFYTPEIDEGLNQLLSEWSLFKKSGLFGTGPKGREHPLFKKIAGLQIPLLLAGRFEGATQEIKQSITDYMNGWRYEQGIIYNQGETFERYLRRVIKHILDLQKKKTSA
jgi:hypothetical protein